MSAVVDERTNAGRLGDSIARPDGTAKVQGSFAFSSDLDADNCLWGATLRSPHPYARIIAIDVTPAYRISGVEAVVTAADVPGKATYGLITQDQPVFASEFVRHVGEPVAAVAADHPETCRRALAAIVVTYEVLEPLTDPERAIDGSHPPIHPDGNVIRHQRIVSGDIEATGEIVVEGDYEIGMQDQAFLGLEAALALPDPGGAGVELHVATQWLHEDQKQIAACLGLAADKVRLALGGVGGAFGAREDLSLQVHACLLALRTGRPVRIQYSREESFLGHVHRHPARIRMRHHATADGRIVKIYARMVLDGGAYASTSAAVLLNAITHAQGPYKCANAVVDGYAVRTNNPPCGAMRGFGVVQACFAHESQMDKLAGACGLDPIEIRLLNAIETGDRLITGQVIENVAPVARCIREAAALPLPDEPVGGHDGDPMRLPGGAGRTAQAQHIRRGIGFAVAMKNLMYSEGFDDYSTARCRLADGVATLKFATSEVGQGFVTIAGQIARSVLGVDDVLLDPIDTGVGSAGSTSASRQTWMSGGAVDAACRKVRGLLFAHVAATHGVAASSLGIDGGDIVDARGVFRLSVVEATTGVSFDETVEYRHKPTEDLDVNGQGDCHTAFAFVAHRAVVDVDPELGLVKVIQVATAQDVGRALNPLSVLGQIEGGIAQGLGLAVMEEIIMADGKIRNPSFTDYLLPTFLDMPNVVATLIEEPDPIAPLGAKGVGEPPAISSTPAIVAAIRDAIGKPLHRVPVRPSDIIGLVCTERSTSSQQEQSPVSSEREIMSWGTFGEASRVLAQMVADDGYEPDMILSIARGGLLIGGALGYALSVKNVYTMNVEFYTGVDERLDVPRILPPAPDFVDVSHARILIADDVADTGHTLRSVQEFCAGKVAEVRSAVLYEKAHSVVQCDYVWKRTDQWINFPWSDKDPVARRDWVVKDA